ncbi:MAG: L-serine ammonia-lyase, iron-sulfur-dependent, subunit alpha [Peptostreptococcaceae bacterium]|jgi:L-serine dehydratase|nr:L-serine ammonia-lyase, iron-sulfur-dependent, subunit alpha [Peptostreptococcaceae bacterium]
MEFKDGKELLELCEKNNKKIYEICIERECFKSNLNKDEVIKKMQVSFNIMKESVEAGLNNDKKSLGGLIGGEGKKILNRSKETKSVCGQLMSKAIASAMGVMEINATMGLVVAAPTAGSCGILPASLMTIKEEFDFSDEDIINALFTASAIGLIVTKNATVAGAEGGCQAETGTASAMSSAAIVELMGGSPKQALDAAAITFKNIMGLVCDPIAGLVEAPCQKRNAIGVSNALISAEMVLAGVNSIIPFDEVVEAMYKVGRGLPYELRETALGGVACTKTGCKITKSIFS